MKVTLLLSCTFILLFSLITNAQSPLKSIRVNSMELQTQPNLHEFTVLKPAFLKEEVNGYFFAYIQFEKLPAAGIRREIQAITGITFLGYLPDNTYYVSIPVSLNVAPLYNFNVRGIYPILPEYKISHLLSKPELPAYAVNADQTIKLNVEYYRSLNQQDVIQKLSDLQIQATAKANFVNVLSITVPKDAILSIASLPFIQYVEPIGPPGIPENYESRTDHRNNFIANDYASGLHYNGDGVWVGMNDDGEIGPHIDYQGRLNQDFVAGDDQGSHGDHVAGIIMGAGNKDPKTRGNAFGANLKVYTAYNGSTPLYEGFYDVPNSYIDPGVKINSTSYSDGCNVGYTTLTQTIDETIWDYPQFMHVFSSGNSSSSGCSGIGQAYYQITGGHKMGKNCITVGNVDKNDVLNSTSSGGPAADGRLKPEICAVGTNVNSTQPNNTYGLNTGTSMACPGIAGNFAMLIHAYRGLNGGATPSSALIKAAMMNTADDLGNPGPDFQYGYGRVNARRAYFLLSNNHYMIDSVDQGDTRSFQLSVPANTKQVRVMVYWADYVAQLGAPKDLVNDLQLIVSDPGNTDYNPWILNPFPNKDTLNLPAHRGIDTLNNHEQVTIDDPVSGNYTITVNGLTVPEGPQKFVVVYEYLFDEITLTYPTGGESWVPSEQEKVRWDSYGNTGTFTLELSSDGGQTWNTISANIDAAKRYYDYNIPSSTIASGNYRMRISRGSISDQSDTTFSIITVPTNLHITSICPSSVSLAWNAASGATGYEVYVLGEKYMESVGTTTATSYDIPGLSIGNTDWVSVRSLGPEGAKGRRAVAIEKDLGLFNCILTTDIAITSIDPPSSSFNSCMGLDGINVVVNVKNNGLNPISNFFVNLQADANPTITETFSGVIPPGDSADYLFLSSIDISASGTHDIKCWLTLVADENHLNDSLSNTIDVNNSPSVTLPFYENFESFTPCELLNNCEEGVCELTNGWLNVTNLSGDDIDWRTNSGPTPGNQTGPDADFDPGNSAGKYLYLEAGGCKLREAFLLTPCLDLTAALDPKLTFAYHMYGTDMGELHVDVFANGEWTEDIMTPVTGNQGNQWKTDTIELSAWNGYVVTVRFRGKTGNGNLSDMALDAIGVFEASDALSAAFITAGVLCVDEVITFTSSSTGNINSYSWNFGANASPATANTAGPHLVTYSASGNKTITLNIENSSGNDSEISNISIADQPVASFSFTSDGLTFTFANTSLNAASYLWDFGDGNTSASASPVHTFANSGTYTVTLTATSTCGSVISTQIIVATGIEAPNDNTILSIYPNPSDGLFNVHMSESLMNSIHLSVFDIAGRKLFDVPNELIHESIIVDLRQYASGIYFLRAYDENGEKNYKLIH